MKKCLCTILALVLMLSCVCLPASAVEIVESDGNQPVARATSRFTIDVKANSSMRASTSFPMEVGEVITIKASYAPFSASVDVGLVGPNGRFHYVTVTDGSINLAIKITERGKYTFAVRNNSAFGINVSGYVNY
ncbi:hypothetical protein [Acutalibacter sp. 1XD8-36]|uniref:hypothetical protein n=1 Tax=Acutalibacter sp. 1XD8-36 TaxID=2320852 RepID=UPI001412A5E3|nr:hypothetical protein [Acutalibacter sp. 1XD8-36]NBJ90881.1 hypothetical protein [Acutalibacter sp. 1XD8-36]